MRHAITTKLFFKLHVFIQQWQFMTQLINTCNVADIWKLESFRNQNQIGFDTDLLKSCLLWRMSSHGFVKISWLWNHELGWSPLLHNLMPVKYVLKLFFLLLSEAESGLSYRSCMIKKKITLYQTGHSFSSESTTTDVGGFLTINQSVLYKYTALVYSVFC